MAESPELCYLRHAVARSGLLWEMLRGGAGEEMGRLLEYTNCEDRKLKRGEQNEKIAGEGTMRGENNGRVLNEDEEK